jgi:hypothetical protein
MRYVFIAALGAIGGGLVVAVATKALPKMMSSMMSKMMGGGQKGERPMMPQMMTVMMPHALGVVLPNMPTEKRIDFASKLVSTLVEHGSAGMSDEQKEVFMAKLVEELKT